MRQTSNPYYNQSSQQMPPDEQKCNLPLWSTESYSVQSADSRV